MEEAKTKYEHKCHHAPANGVDGDCEQCTNEIVWDWADMMAESIYDLAIPGALREQLEQEILMAVDLVVG